MLLEEFRIYVGLVDWVWRGCEVLRQSILDW
jgi:hypothetical protein